MIDWWNSLELATQIFYCIAIPSTLILLVQTVLTFMGIGDGVDADADVDVDVDNTCAPIQARCAAKLIVIKKILFIIRYT